MSKNKYPDTTKNRLRDALAQLHYMRWRQLSEEAIPLDTAVEVMLHEQNVLIDVVLGMKRNAVDARFYSFRGERPIALKKEDWWRPILPLPKAGKENT